MEKILQLDEPLDIPLFDEVVSVFYEGKGTSQEQRVAGEILSQFQSLPNAWLQVDKILDSSNKLQSKFIGLNILEQLITTKWNSLPKEQQSGIWNFLIGMILASSNSNTNIELTHKADYVLIQILKRDWNESLIKDLIESSSASLSLCQNNMYILRIIAEEILVNNNSGSSDSFEEVDFTISKDLTKAKIFKLKNALFKDFQFILRFCYEVLNNVTFDSNSNNIKDIISLANSTIITLNRYLAWLPIKSVMDSDIVTLLIEKFLVQNGTRSNTLKCLTTLFNIKNPNYVSGIPDFETTIIQYFNYILQIISNNCNDNTNNNILFLESRTNFNDIYQQSKLEDQLFIQDWEIFLCTFLHCHRSIIEGICKDLAPQYNKLLLKAHQYILQMTTINDKEIFKIALDYWHDLVSSLFIEIENYPFNQINPYMDEVSLGTGALNPSLLKQLPLKRNFYSEICSKLREIIINCMVKPEEFQITMTEDGNFAREVFTETENIQLYETEREVLVLLTHLDVEDMENLLWKQLVQLKENNILFKNSGEHFNKISWAIGSISGTMRVETEQNFLIKILNLFGELYMASLTKEQIIIYSSNIMYIVGQYSRFLKNHWSFFYKVMQQLFSMMHNENVAIRDMACDTFYKISSKCKYQMVTMQECDQENKPFIRVILEDMPNIVPDLNSSQLNRFFETCAMIINQEQDFSTLRDLTVKLMRNENLTWQRIVSQFRLNSKFFLDLNKNDSDVNEFNNCQALIHVLRINISVSKALSYNYFEQMQYIYLDMLDIYVNISSLIKDAIQQQTSNNTNNNNKIIETPQIRLFRIIKKEILRLMQCFIQNTKDSKIIILDILTPFMNATLSDYQNSPSELKEYELLKCLTIILQKCGDQLINHVIQLFPLVIEPTLMMINKDMISYPDHRREYYELLNAIDKNCFQVFLELPICSFKLFFDSICWAMKHTNREIESLGIDSALIMLSNIDTHYRDTNIFKVFFQEYYLSLINETFYILTEPDHKSTFTEQSMLLTKLINLSFNDDISVSIYEKINGIAQDTTNKDYLMQYMAKLLLSEFDNLKEEQVRTFLNVLVTEIGDLDLFKTTLRDFLVQIKEMDGDPTDYLFFEEREMELKMQRKSKEERASRIAGWARSY